MAIRLTQNNYGKSRVRLLRVTRGETQDVIKEMTLAIHFEGDFDLAHTKGDNSKILPTDTMKNTVYAMARKQPVKTIEDFSSRLVEHFLANNPQVSRVEIEAVEDLWTRISVAGQPHGSAFARAGEEKRTAVVDGTRQQKTVRGGITNLVALKTTGSAFEGFLKDPFTTLPEDRRRVFSTSIRGDWLYQDGPIDFDGHWEGVRNTLLEAFAMHDSQSVQHTLYAMAEATLARFSQIREIRLSLPNRHYNLVNLSAFGMENPAEVFLPTDEPHGLIEARVGRE